MADSADVQQLHPNLLTVIETITQAQERIAILQEQMLEFFRGKSSPPPKTQLNPEEAADFTGICKKTLAEYRSQHRGPPYSKRGRHIYYDRNELVDWMRKGKVRPMAD